MKKIIFIFLFLFTLGIENTYSAWYGGGWYAMTYYDGATWCPSDGDTTGGSPYFASGGYNYDSQVTSTSGSDMYCQFWDGSNPESLSVGYTSGWTNSTKTITIQAKDRGGSKLKKMELYQSQNGGGWGLVASWDNLNSQNTLVTQTWNRTPVDGSNFKYRLISYDYSGNNITLDNASLIQFDTTAPTVSDIPDTSSTPANNSNLLASNGQTFTITPSVNGGSPIVKIQGFFENSADCSNGFIARIDSNSSSLSTTALTHNIKEVKPSCDFNAGGYRDYSFKVTYIEDATGNFLGTLNAASNNAGIKTFSYKVFANTLLANIGTKSVTTDQVTSGNNNVADGTQKNIIITLKDIYLNPIIPASFIGRNISYIFDVNNNLYINQSNNSGGAAVFMSIPSDSGNFLNTRFSGMGNQIQTFSNQPSTDGTFTFGNNVYSPTNHVIVGNDFTINNIKFTVTRTTPIAGGDNPTNQVVGGSSLVFSFKPIYQANFAGEIATSGFIEGRIQSGSIDINQNGAINPTIDGMYFLQTGTGSSYFTGTGKIDSDSDKNILTTGIGTKFILNSFNLVSDYLFRTLFTLNDGAGYLDDIKNVQLKSYISYTLSGKPVTYLVGILNNINTQNFETLKIYGITNIDKSKQKDLVINQDKNDVKNLAGEISKSGLRRDISKSALNIVKFIQPNNGSNLIDNLTGLGWTNSDGKNLGNILYFGDLAGANVVLNNGNLDNTSTNKFEGKKTIIIKGGNLYIKSNIINNTSSDILGIIVMADESNNGGKVYIDTNLQEIDAVIYADKSVISYNPNYDNGNIDTVKSHEVDGNIDNQSMQNQLYIYGTVFSENTIGGSRKNPPVCPFWAKQESINCTTVEAQKYDFNYLRAGSGNKYKSSYANFPIIIRYNSTIQSTPPPLFGQ